MKLFNEKEYSLISLDGTHVNDLGMNRIANTLMLLLKD